MTRVTLDLEPAFDMRQLVFEVPMGARYDFDAIIASGYSVSLFTRWDKNINEVWIKSRVTMRPSSERGDLFGAVAARSTATRSSA